MRDLGKLESNGHLEFWSGGGGLGGLSVLLDAQEAGCIVDSCQL